MEIIIGATIGLLIVFVAYMILKDYNREENLNIRIKPYNEAFEILTKGYKECSITYGEYIDGCNKLNDLWNSTN